MLTLNINADSGTFSHEHSMMRMDFSAVNINVVVDGELIPLTKVIKIYQAQMFLMQQEADHANSR